MEFALRHSPRRALETPDILVALGTPTPAQSKLNVLVKQMAELSYVVSVNQILTESFVEPDIEFFTHGDSRRMSCPRDSKTA